MALLAIISCIYAWQRGAVVPMTADMGVGFLSANLWISSKFASALMGVGLTILSAILLVWINSIYNVLRSITSLVATMFIMMQIGVPSLMGQFTPVYRAADHGLGRRITSYEYRKVIDEAVRLGLTDGYMQQKSSAREEYTPSFDLQGV